MIVGPLGDVLAGPSPYGEALVAAEIDPADIVRARYDFDAVGHYARADIFSLSVDESARAAVTAAAIPVIVAAAAAAAFIRRRGREAAQ
jgi:predicted NAD-dependent protein-ADP-ribosyltransferase YbiA (DUF1768 family)